MSKPFRIIMALVLALSVVGAVSVTAAAQVEPEVAVITVEVDPGPPNYVVNDGTMSQGIRWTIQFDSTPDHYTFVIRTFPGGVDVAGTFMNVDISSESSPGTVNNPEWAGYHTWLVPLGQAAGSYIARVEYWSNVGFESSGEQVFYVNDKAHLTAVITTPADDSTQNVSTDFTVSATITNTGDSPATGVEAQLNIDAHASVVAGANPQPLGVIPAGEFAVATWTVHCDSEGDSVITVTPSGTDGTSGETILQENIEGDSITVHQQDLRGTLIVFKFNDLDGDGVQDGGELGLENWEFDISGIGTRFTDANGLITETNLQPGQYTVTETVKPGWRVTTANPQIADVPPDGSDQVDFGNQELGTLEVFKFNDLNEDGDYDPGEGETPLDGWQFNISGGVGMRITSGGGLITEPNLIPGAYTVTETVKPGWTVTTANPQIANVLPGGTDRLEFGNHRPVMVPTLTQWGIIGMIVVFGGLLLVWTARRRLASRAS